MHPDDVTLLDILANRSDLGRPRRQAHFFFLPTRAAAEQVLAHAGEQGWEQAGEITQANERGELPWALTVERTDRPTNRTTIPAIRERFTDLASQAGGLYDGWQASTDVGMDHPADDAEGENLLLEELDAEDRRAIDQLVPLLEELGALATPEALVEFLDAGRAGWEELASQDPSLVDDILHLVGTAAGEQVARVTGLRWALMVQGDTEEVVLADAERGIVRPYSMATEWWEDGGKTDVADFIRAAILMVTGGQ